MKPAGKKKAKKKKMPEPGAQNAVPRPVGFSSPVQECARRAQIFRTLAENHNPTPEDVKQAEWCKAHGRVARSQSALSLQMGELGMAGHLPPSQPRLIPRFDSPIHQSLGPPSTAWRSQTYGLPPEGGERRYKSRDERLWLLAHDKAMQTTYMLEAQAQHYALARGGQELKCQRLALQKEAKQLQHQELEYQLQMEGYMIHMYHCPLHMLLEQTPEHCICCENNQANIARLKLATIHNDKLLRQNAAREMEVRAHQRTIDEATWGARLEAERAEGQLNYRVTSSGDYIADYQDRL